MTNNDFGPERMRLARRIGRWMQQRDDIGHLQALPDHMLKDIGLHRSQIISTVVGGKARLNRGGY